MPVLRGGTQSRWDYVNVRGFGAGTVEPVGRSRAIVLLPVGGREGINQHGELAVVEQAQRAEQPTADRDRSSFNARSAARNGREYLTGAPWRERKILAVELPQVEFVGARQCPGGRNQAF